MHAERETSPASVLDAVNGVLRTDIPATRFVTMIYAVLDPAARALVYANAGHPPPVLSGPGGSRLLKTRAELPLGVNRQPYTDHRVEMASGDRLVLYSDGVTEARNPESEEFGLQRVLDCVADPGTGVNGLLDAVTHHTGAHPTVDDITVAMIEALE
jgi:sigma-B regulation protein RsbU (phosphoserine phosphatase)